MFLRTLRGRSRTNNNSSISSKANLVALNQKTYAKRRSKLCTLLVRSLIVLSILSILYIGIIGFVAARIAYAAPQPETRTPANYGLDYRDVTFSSRYDHVQLRGWFIPGVLSGGRLTVDRTIIMVHGLRSNRADPLVIGVAAALARHGFAVLALDLRGHGQSASAPLSLGYYEQRDVLGAVDFLRSGQLPYPQLGHPRIIGGWGDSMGGATMLLAAAREPAIRSIVTDSAFAALVPLLDRTATYPTIFIPSVLEAMQILYNANYYAVRPVDVVASIAPRPLFFIQGTKDSTVPAWNMDQLAHAAEHAPDAHVQTWLVPGAEHIQSFHLMGQVYVGRVVSFFNETLGPPVQA
jgi:fermentation-respiration switch protein FrsA (DUF1100 family)